jgi:hypothetical protein
MENKVVFKNYDRELMLEVRGSVLSVTAGALCDEGSPPGGVDPSEDPSEGSSARAGLASSVVGFAAPFALGLSMGLPVPLAVAASTVGGLLNNVPRAEAQFTSECDLVLIEVDIYVGDMANEIVMREAQSGNFEVCPPESLYWKHHPKVFGGYEGCVGETGYYPCAQDSQGIRDSLGDGLLRDKYPLNWDGEKCVETGYATETRTYWILWGDPLDKFELNKRTG